MSFVPRSDILPDWRSTFRLARSESVAVHMHAGGATCVALALRVAWERVDVHLAARIGLLIGQMLRMVLCCKCRVRNPERHRNRERDQDRERPELRHGASSFKTRFFCAPDPPRRGSQ